MLFLNIRKFLLFTVPLLVGFSAQAMTVDPARKIHEARKAAMEDLARVAQEISGMRDEARNLVGQTAHYAHCAQQAIKQATEAAIAHGIDAIRPALAEEAVKNAVKVEAARQKVQVKAAKDLARARRQGEIEAEMSPEGQELLKRRLESERQAHVEAAAAAERVQVEAGIHDKKIQADVEKHKFTWDSIKNMFTNLGEGLSNPVTMGKVALGVGICGIAYYGVKHYMPILIAKWTRPVVISKTSLDKSSTESGHDLALSDFKFNPELQAKLDQVTEAIQNALKHKTPLPNMLFHGPPGTGKTSFVHALALASGCEFALTSGSEFAKLKDLEHQNSELRKLLMWAKYSSKPILIFIDEAETLFADRRLPTTKVQVVEFINTFLAMVDRKSQPNFCFIFGTNNSYVLDVAIDSRVGLDIAFENPNPIVCGEILSTYVEKDACAKEGRVAVHLEPALKARYAQYGRELCGLAPRAIQYIAERMVNKARFSVAGRLTVAIADEAVREGKQEIARVDDRKKARDEYINRVLIAAKG